MPRVRVTDHGAVVAARYDIVRSSKWPAVERAHLAKQPNCVACKHPGARVEVHHIFPFHFCVALGRPDLELDERNLVTLCAESDERGVGDHHLLLGHFDDWESMNVHVRRQAERDFHGMTALRIRASDAWRAFARSRPEHFGCLTQQQRQALRLVIDHAIPHA